MTILITGATGLVGTALIHKWSQHQINVLTTQKSLTQTAAQNKVTYYYWNPETGDVDASALTNVSTIIHLAGASIADQRWTSSRKQEIIDSRIKSTQLLFHLLQNYPNQVRHFISASASGWYTPDPEKRYTEEEPAATDTFLGKVCALWESSALQINQLGIPVSIVRTSMVLSPTGGAFIPLKKSLISPIVPLFGNGRQLVSWITIDDLVEIYHFLLEHKATGIFNACATEVITQKTMMQRLGQKRWKNNFLTLPTPVFILKLALGDMAQDLLINSIGMTNKAILDKGFQLQYPAFDNHTLQYLFRK